MGAITEEEAKKRWCPMVRGSWSVASTMSYPAEHGVAGNRDVNGSEIPNTCCIASGCMMWRTEREHFKAPTKEREQHVGWECSPHPESNYATYHRNDRGYCGLAGSQP
jgi:hypothetical protein